MHGRGRSEYKEAQRNPSTAAALASKADKWHVLSNELKQRRQASDWSETSLDLTAKALVVHPDPLYLWNQRREILENNSALFSLSTEQAVTQSALLSNPKAYGAWLHRKWALSRNHDRTGQLQGSTTRENLDNKTATALVIQQELALTAMLLQRDERNFHCWSYRRFLVSCQLRMAASAGASSRTDDGSWVLFRLDDSEDERFVASSTAKSAAFMGAQIAWKTKSREGESPIKTLGYQEEITKILCQEWEFTNVKIKDNFSNFSAFHYRTKLLPLILANGSKDDVSSPRISLEDELELVEQAVFTEPDDQTAWWYQRFVLDQMMTTSTRRVVDASYKARVDLHISNLRELAADAPSSKWVWLGLWNALESTGLLHSNATEQRALLSKLVELDSDRKNRYQYLIDQLPAE